MEVWWWWWHIVSRFMKREGEGNPRLRKENKKIVKEKENKKE